MCGISGVLVSPSDLARIEVDEVMAILMREMEQRGKEATGIARVTASNRVRLAKYPVPASQFLATHPGIGAGCRLVIAHSRLSTQGDPKDNVNNHPIVCDNIIGVHNGCVSNDYELYRKYGWTRVGKVDSEAIFAAINHLGAKVALEELEGSIAVAWIDKSDPGALWMARHTSSPLNVGITEGGSVIFASTNAAVAKAAVLFPGSITIDAIKEGAMLRFVHTAEGVLEHQITEFKPPEKIYISSYGSVDAWDYSRGGSWTAGGFRRASDSKAPAATGTQGSTSSKARQDTSWVIGGGGYVLKPDDAVVFVPDDPEFCDLIGTFKAASYKSGMSFIEMWFDKGCSDEVVLPTKRIYPLHVWRDEPDKIPTKGAFALDAAAMVPDDDDVNDADVEAILNDHSERGEQYWEALVAAEEDEKDDLADALILAYKSGMEIEQWVNQGGELVLPRECQWDEDDGIIDVSSVEVN
ncbi:MAG TPA: hypothetical protein VNC22_23355 [Sporichthya sp.]|nr:hypothetical protein [Sporichthya sp.]